MKNTGTEGTHTKAHTCKMTIPAPPHSPHRGDTNYIAHGHETERNCIDFLGIKVDNIDAVSLIGRMVEFASGNIQRTVMYVNAACMLIAEKNPQYRQVLNSADIVYPDGIGIVLGARIFGYRLPGRSTAADFITDLCRACAKADISIFFLGAKDGIAAQAAQKLMNHIPRLRIVGTHHGYFSTGETENIISMINRSGAKMVIVGFGAPAQELWIREYGERLNARCLWGVGGLFDFVSGKTPRGPKWLIDNGFEWLCRLFVEPRRLWKRYIPGNINFLYTILKYRLFHGN